jgi:hypothetical protein
MTPPPDPAATAATAPVDPDTATVAQTGPPAGVVAGPADVPG